MEVQNHGEPCVTILPATSPSGQTGPTTPVGKVAEIFAACAPERNVSRLIYLATSTDGFVRDEVRKQAWPCLLDISATSAGLATVNADWKIRPPHKDEGQVSLDVDRSFVFYPNNLDTWQLEQRKAQLQDLIIYVLRSFPQLNYFQGFHDIAQVLLLVLGPEKAPHALVNLSLLRIRDFMLPSLSASITQLNLIPVIIRAVNRRLYQHLLGIQPFFALSATLTMYAHDIQEYRDIARLFDFLIAQPAVVSIYFFAVIVLSRQEELFKTPKDEPEMLHAILSKLPIPLDLEFLICRTMTTFRQHPPKTLGWAWWQVPNSSTLKTTLHGSSSQSTRDGEMMLAQQLAQLRRQERRQRVLSVMQSYRKSSAQVGIALAVVVLAYWLTKRDVKIPLFGVQLPRL